MKVVPRPWTILAMSVLLASSGAAAAARDGHDHEDARAALARGEILPLTRILAVVAQQNPGDILAVELEREDGRFIYEVRVLTPAGKVAEVELDAKTGTVLDDRKGGDARADRRR